MGQDFLDVQYLGLELNSKACLIMKLLAAAASKVAGIIT